MLLFILLLTFIGLAVALVWFLLSNDRGEKEPIDALWIAVAFGIFGALLAGFLESKLIEPDNLIAGMPTVTMLKTALMVGFIEEICKFVPLAIYIYKKRYFNEHTDGVIYFALAGLGFGLPENIMYTLQYGTKTGLIRLLLTPLFHAATTALLGYFLISRKLSGKSAFGVVIPLIIVAGLHGFYDFGLAQGSTIFAIVSVSLTLCLSAALFVIYMRATDKDQEMGISAVGHNAFCRSCGKPNPKHKLYCAHCGKNA